jgi:uncharacterized secreted repeat protein (TIGR03808 family)
VLPTGARLIGVPGATRIVATDNAPIIVARGADHILLSGIIFDGSGKTLPRTRLIQLANGRGIAIRDCEVLGAAATASCSKASRARSPAPPITGALGAAIHALDSRGLVDRAQHDPQCRQQRHSGLALAAGDDGTQVLDNRIEDTAAQSGGSGQNGNAINVFRATT